LGKLATAKTCLREGSCDKLMAKMLVKTVEFLQMFCGGSAVVVFSVASARAVLDKALQLFPEADQLREVSVTLSVSLKEHDAGRRISSLVAALTSFVQASGEAGLGDLAPLTAAQGVCTGLADSLRQSPRFPEFRVNVAVAVQMMENAVKDEWFDSARSVAGALAKLQDLLPDLGNPDLVAQVQAVSRSTRLDLCVEKYVQLGDSEAARLEADKHMMSIKAMISERLGCEKHLKFCGDPEASHAVRHLVKSISAAMSLSDTAGKCQLKHDEDKINGHLMDLRDVAYGHVGGVQWLSELGNLEDWGEMKAVAAKTILALPAKKLDTALEAVNKATPSLKYCLQSPLSAITSQHPQPTKLPRLLWAHRHRHTGHTREHTQLQ
jgi:hypothetical protein